MKAFWQINKAWVEMLAKFDESGGEETDDLSELLAINKSNLQEKIEEQLTVVEQLEFENVRIKATQERLAEQKERNIKLIKDIKVNIANVLDKYSDGKLKTDEYSLSVKRTKELRLFDANLVPSKYIRWNMKTTLNDAIKRELTRIMPRLDLKFEPQVDKIELKRAIENGEVITNAGFDVVENETIIRK